MNIASEPFTASVRVPIPQLPNVVSSGLLHAKCEACAITVTPRDLEALRAEPFQTGKPKHDRLRLHYCARNGCDGRFYLVQVQADSPESLARLQSQIEEVASPFFHPKRTPDSSDSPGPWKILKLALVSIICLYLAIVLHRLYYGGRIPLLQKANHYQTEGVSRTQ